ncbi:RHS repeat domain-containing protein [Chryseobacterium pennipullorum]|uniref:YD repeat-containing protein n=1 Tax=Chryseobacterium pennipullorum TaxID=2258963 RepID=A0A3D9ALH4_9FLAO|nr:hypothetical protein [Chryseobacterium pennipullorum]REC41836.1 hypothetical protein DRF67_21055 [Chryseobacterium pennipullorum]
MRKNITTILSILTGAVSYAQLNIKPPNTDAISVFNFTESPVSLHTGLVDISYPIYEIKTPGLTIPINLSYFSRGVRVDEIGSYVGIGWSLNYGGMISRQIREGADEEGTFGYLNNKIYDNFFTNNTKRVEVVRSMQTLSPNDKYDFAPDQFYFSIADYSGKFIFDRNDKKPLQQPFTDIKIEPDWSQGSVLHSWLITDTKGNRYYYGRNTEKNFNYESRITAITSIQPMHPNRNSAIITEAQKVDPDTWYLQKIITATNDTIKYNYVSDIVTYYKKDYDIQRGTCVPLCVEMPKIGEVNTYFSDVQEEKFVLESIEFPQGKLEFVLGSDIRQDVKFGFPLKKIVVYDKYNKPIESYTLIHNYFNAYMNAANTNTTLVGLDSSSKKRMFLKEIVKEGFENNSPVLIEKTKYNYNTTPLPDRFSTSKDLWGYSNYQNNGTFDHFYDDAYGNVTNRTTDEVYSKAGTLTSIELPTGEKRVFEYENNKLQSPYLNYNKILGFVNTDGLGNYYGPGQRIKAIKYYDGDNLKMKKTYEYTFDGTSSTGKLFGSREYRAILGTKYYYPPGTPITILDPGGVLLGDSNSALESRDFGYSLVKEYLGDPTINSGKIDYTFTNHPDTWNFAEYPFHWPNDNNWMRGLLLNQKYYENKNNTYILRKEINNRYKIGGFDYDFIEDLVGPQPGFTFAFPPAFNYEKTNYFYKMPLARIYLDNRIKIELAGPPPANSPYLISSDAANKLYWSFKPYVFTGGRIEKDETVVTSYNSNNQITTKTKYTYPSYSNNVSKITSTDTDGAILLTDYSYAQEKGNQLMISKNMVGIPLETMTSKTIGNATKTISKVETVYPPAIPTSQTGNLVLPLSVRSFNIQNPTDSNSATTDITYDQYDTNGNLQQYTTKDGISTVIIWGYDNTQPIAKIENAKLADIGQSFITAIVNASNTDAAAGRNNDESSLLSAFTTFRGQLPNHQITTYSYDPLIGVRSITPPSGIREVYLYDAAGRLNEIRENNQTGRLVKEFKYNYKN